MVSVLSLKEKAKGLLSSKNERSAEAKKNIVYSLILKGASILVSLVLVPLTINYVNPTQYGIWLTISSIVGWIAFFDFGLGNGLRNKFTEAKAKGDLKLAREYVSTAYVTLSLIVVILLFASVVVSFAVNWPSLLHVSDSYQHELCWAFFFVSSFFCLGLVANLITTILTADQRPSFAALITFIGQLMSLMVIFLLTKLTSGSLSNLALYYSGIPAAVLVVSSIIIFRFSRYREIAPRISMFRRLLVKDIIGLGAKFFLICLCMLVIFQLINIIISRELGPLAVTQYNIAYKYFSTLFMVILIFINPFWSAFTDAYAKEDYSWMKHTLRKLERFGMLAAIPAVLMIICANYIYVVWVGHSISVPLNLTICMAIYIYSMIWGNIYMYMVNGLGKVFLQTIIYVFFSIIAWPIFTMSCRYWGIIGVLLIPSVTYLFQAVICKMQLTRLLNRTDRGLWSK